MLYQSRILPLAATLAVSALAACSGGGGSSVPTTPLAATSTAAATPIPVVPATPTATTAPAAAGAALATAPLVGAAGFVNAQSHTVYVFDADLAAPGTSTCSGQCSTVWPAIAAAANTTYPAPFTAIKRSDGTLQLAYAGRPLYSYIADSVAGSVAGNGITSFGAVWHIARPAAAVSVSTVTPAPTPTPLATTTPAPVY